MFFLQPLIGSANQFLECFLVHLQLCQLQGIRHLPKAGTSKPDHASAYVERDGFAVCLSDAWVIAQLEKHDIWV